MSRPIAPLVLLLSVLLIAACQTAAGPEPEEPVHQDAAGFEAELRAAMDYEEMASNLNEVLTSAHQFEQLAYRYPDEWLPPYWAAFVYTQVRVFGADTTLLKPHLTLAQYYYDQSYERWLAGADTSATERADLYALQGFIHRWSSRLPEDDLQGIEARQVQRDANYYDRALEYDPDQPMVWAMRALGKLRADSTRTQGIEESLRAARHYRMREGTTRPRWGASFAVFWFQNFAPESLDALAEAYGSDSPITGMIARSRARADSLAAASDDA